MGPMNLHFDVRDIFRAPRLALGGKKIWIMLIANLVGYAGYWLLTYASLLAAGISFNQAWSKYGLYPCLFGNEVTYIPAWILYVLGSIIWLIMLVLGSTAVARVTYKQLKGDEFYSSGDAWKFVKKHWHAPVFTHLSIALIVLFFVVMAAVFALIGKIPYFGELFFAIPYLLWFFGSVFVAYTLVVLVISVFFTHAIVGTLEEDTMGAVFQNYSITWSQPWRIVLYLTIICGLMYAGLLIFGWFMRAGYELINIVYGHKWLMGDKLANMVGWATNIVIGPNSPIAWGLGCYSGGICSINVPIVASPLGPMEYIGGTFIAVFLFLIIGTVISYAFAIEAVGETIALVIFKKKSDDENLLERKDEEELEAETDKTDWTESEEDDKDEKGDSDSEESDEEGKDDTTSEE